MSRGERLFGPKRNTRRNKREYRRERNEARKAKRIESEIEMIVGYSLRLVVNSVSKKWS